MSVFKRKRKTCQFCKNPILSSTTGMCLRCQIRAKTYKTPDMAVLDGLGQAYVLNEAQSEYEHGYACGKRGMLLGGSPSQEWKEGWQDGVGDQARNLEQTPP